MPGDVVDRTTVLRRVREWSSDRAFLLVGAPGSGKSEIARQVVRTVATGYQHWCDSQDDATLSPLQFVNSLALALAERYPGYAERLVHEARPDIVIHADVRVSVLTDGARAQAVVINSLAIADMPPRVAFDRLIRVPLDSVERESDPFLVVVDALDESLSFHETAHLADLIAHAVSTPGLRFLITCRSGETRVTDRIGPVSLDLDQHPDGDLLNYAWQRLAGMREPDRTVFAERVAAAGNFLYVRHVLDALGGRPATIDITTVTLPRSLADVYRDFLSREIVVDRRNRDWITRYRPVLGLVAVGRGRDGLPVQLLAEAAGLPRSAVLDVLLACGQFIRTTGDRPEDMRARIYHRSFQEFLLTDTQFTVFPDEAHEAIAHVLGANSWVYWRGPLRDYGLAYLPVHLHEAGLTATLVELAHDDDFLAAQARQSPNDPTVEVATIRLALDASCRVPAPVPVARLLLRLSARLSFVEAQTPLAVLERHGLEPALDAVRDLDGDVRVVNELLLGVALLEAERKDDARYVLQEILARSSGRLTDRVAGYAALLLATLCTYEPDLARALAARNLGLVHRQYLVRHLLCLDNYQSALNVASSIEDMTQRYTTFFGMIEHILDRGQIDQARILIESVGESVHPDSEPDPGQTLWWVFDTVVWVVALCLVMKGDDGRGRAVLRRRSQAEPAELLAASGFAASCAGDDDAAHRAFADAEGAASSLPTGGDYDAGVLAARTWLFIAKTYAWTDRMEDARRVAIVAAAHLPPLEEMADQPFYGSPTHDDAFHGPCLQGAYLELACLAARAGDVATASPLARALARLGSPDAVEAFTRISTGPGVSADDARSADAEAAGVVNSLDHQTRSVVKAQRALIISASTRRPSSEDFTWDRMTHELDALIKRLSGPDRSVHSVERSRERIAAATNLFNQAGPDVLGGTIAAWSGDDANTDVDPDEPGSAYDYIRRAESLRAGARAAAASGEHAKAMRRFRRALTWDARAESAWSVFQAMARVPKTTDRIGADNDRATASRVAELCRLTALATSIGDGRGVAIYLDEAYAAAQEIKSPSVLSRSAGAIASAAARGDALDFIGAVLPLMTIRRRSLLSELWLAYCDTRPARAVSGIAPELAGVLPEIVTSWEAAVSACAGLTTLFPADAHAIGELVDDSGSA